MTHLIQDPIFFYAVAFIIFVGLAVRFGRKPAFDWIDAEIAKIKAELDQASQLRAEAEAALAACRAKQAKSEAEARTIIAQAQKQAEALRQRAEKELAEIMARQEQVATDRIRMAESEAVAEVRAAAIGLAAALARKTLSENLSESDAGRLADQAISDLPALGGGKAKAA